MFSGWRAVRTYEECVEVLDLPLAALDLPLAVVHASIERLDGFRKVGDGCEDSAEGRFFGGRHRGDVFEPVRAIRLVNVNGWIQGALAVSLMSSA